MTVTKMTDKGQVTIPIELRRELGFEGGDTFMVERQGDGVMIRPAVSYAQRTAEIFAKYLRPVPLTIEEEREAFELGLAEDAEDYER